MRRAVAAAVAAVLLAAGCAAQPTRPVTTLDPEQQRLVEHACWEWRRYLRDLPRHQAEVCQTMGWGK